MTPGAARRLLARPASGALLCASLVLPNAGPAAATPQDDARREAVELVKARRCEDALPALEQARRNDPGDARLPFLAAECQIRLQRYADALVSLAEARRIDPRLPGTDLYFGIAHYHTGDLVAAQKDLEAARETSPGNAEVQLYLGLILLQRSQNREAAVAFDRARRADARAVEPVASYYEGLAWRAADEREKARESLLRVREIAPGSEWAAAAARALEGEEGWGPRQSFEELMVGTEWDTNVTLAGNDITPGEISGRRDLRTVWSALAGTEIYRGRGWTVGGLVNYYGSAQTTLSQFDLEYPGASLWVDRRVSDDVTVRLQTAFNYAWYGYEPYQAVGALTPSVYKSWGEYGLSWAYANFYGGDYFFQDQDLDASIGPPGVNEEAERNRDGWGVTAGVLHTIPLPLIDTDLRGGFNYYHYWSVGQEWRYNGVEPLLGFHTRLPWEIGLDGQASFIYRSFYNPSTYPQNQTPPYQFSPYDRRDNVWQFEVKLERPITPWLKVSARYYYMDQGSNTNVFDYVRQIWGGYLTVSFRQE